MLLCHAERLPKRVSIEPSALLTQWTPRTKEVRKTPAQACKPRIMSQMRRNFWTTCTQIVHEEKSC